MVYFKEDYLTIHYDANLELIHLEWNTKFISDAQYKKGCEAALKLIQEKKCTRWLGDLTNMGVIPMESQHWTNQNWFPRLFESSLQHMALLVSKDVFNKVAVNNIINKANGITFATKYFQNKAEALAWLKIQKTQPVAA
ncbi:STAS/SEC14 domain-containing protein [Rhodocytophaga aerolata]|uniref:STAS/SEC14 domain-containing protein n=1 Tax=Rhodocytophaga aerolata TaxID=455078 RepID=A0ABT8R569_9BACT|nr:STAS/SEC14 domain-containing protein [Rhodocytophaga aerolata]MDO1447245.1 STAS/SEC14 domain-containing protein [Rhodocytophaga aerolata]